MSELQQQSVITLKYLDIKGVAEPIRLALFIGGVPFADERVSYEDVAAMRDGGSSVSPTGQVPILTVDGVPFSQSCAILRYVGRMTGLYPEGLRQLRVDMIEETLKDLRAAFVPLWYRNCMCRNPRSGELPPGTALTDQQVAEALKLVNDDYVPARLAQIESLLASSSGLRGLEHRGGGGGGGEEAAASSSASTNVGGPFVCGEDISIADLSLYVMLAGLTSTDPNEASYCPGVDGAKAKEALRGFPRITALLAAVASHPKVAEWNTTKYRQQ